MSVNYTIDHLIAVSQGSLAEMRLAGEGLSKAISTTVMGLSPADVTSRKSSIYGELLMGQGVHRHILSRFPPDVYNREVSAAAGVMTEFAFHQLCLERTRVMEALEAIDVPSMDCFRKVSRALASVTTAAKAV